MDETVEWWYFSMMRTGTLRSSGAYGTGIRRVSFDRRKYGRHLLIDVAWVHELSGFILGAPHSLDFFDVILIERGRGWFWIDSQRHAIHPGVVFFTTPGQVRWWDTQEVDGICLFFEDFFIKEFLQDDAFLHRLPCFRAEPARAALALTPAFARRVRARLVAMRRELAHFGRDSVDLLRAQLHETLIVLARQYAAAHRVAPLRPTHRVVSRFMELIERDAAHRHSIADYAADLAVTPGYLSALCREYEGQRPKRLLDNVLAARARRMLLCTDESAARIGASLGFEDPSYFSRFFRRETGQSPTEFRKAPRG
jgi:AraC family transcriptional regulator, transcriptional activator of pobA